VRARDVLKEAQAAGVLIQVDGSDLVLDAQICPPEPLLRELANNKADIIRLLGGSGPSDAQTLFDERAVLVEEGAGVPREWAEGFARLDVSRRPDGFSQRQWEQIVSDGGRFLDHGWAERAVAIGWSAVDVFGVHPLAPSARYDGMGLVPLISGGQVVDIKPDRATIMTPSEETLVYYLRRESRIAIPLWDLPGARAPARKVGSSS